MWATTGQPPLPSPPGPRLHAHPSTWPTRGQQAALSTRSRHGKKRAPRPKRAPSVRLTCYPRAPQAERRGQVDSPAPAHAAAAAHERRGLAQPWRQVGHLRAAPHRPARPERIAARLPRRKVRRCIFPPRACEPRAHHMHTTCTLLAHHMHSCAPPMHTPRTPHARRLHTECTPRAQAPRRSRSARGWAASASRTSTHGSR